MTDEQSEPLAAGAGLNIVSDPGTHFYDSRSPTQTGFSKFQRVTSEDFEPRGEGIMGTARSQIGFPLAPSQIRPDSIITIDGQETRVDIAEQLGLIRKTANGYEPALPPPTASPSEEAPKEPTGEALADSRAEALITDFASRSSPSSQIQAVLEFAKNGEVSERTAGAIASQMGLEPYQVQGALGEIMGGFHAQAAAVMQKHGVTDPDSVLAWARENKPDMLRNAIWTQATERKTAGFVDLAKHYVENLDRIDPQQVLSAEFGEGITVYQDGNAVVLNVEGHGTMTYREALRAGLIRVSPVPR